MIPATPIPYVGKKSKYLHLIDQLLGGKCEAEGLVDLTSGSGTVPLFFHEHYGVQDLMLNDVSAWAELVARCFFQQQARDKALIHADCQGIAPHNDGLVSNTMADRSFYPSWFTRDVAAWIDGFCLGHQDDPLMLVAISCVLLKGAGRFSQLVRKWTRSLNPTFLAEQVEGVATRLTKRQRLLPAFEWRKDDYLALPDRYDEIEGRIVYLDPAWPSQILRKTHTNLRIYGLYAHTIMSILRQGYVKMPEEYAVPAPMFWIGMRNTIRRMLQANDVFVAYQTTGHEIGEVTARLFMPDLKYKMVSADKNPTSKLREYLFRVEN